MKKFVRWSPLIMFLALIVFVLGYPKVIAMTTKHGAFRKSIGYTDKTYDLRTDSLQSDEAIAFARSELVPTEKSPTFYILTYNNNLGYVYYVSNVKFSEKNPDRLVMGSPYPIKTGSKEAFNDAMEEAKSSGFQVRYIDEQVTIYERAYDGNEFVFDDITYIPEYFLYGSPLDQ